MTTRERLPSLAKKRTPLAIAGGLLAVTLAIGALARVPALRGGPPEPVLAFAAPPGGLVSFHGRLDRGAVQQGGDGLVRLELAIAAPGRTERFAPALPTDLVVVLDRSSSMNGRKIAIAREAIRSLVGELSPRDRFALVSYANGARLEIPLEAAAPARVAAWRRVVDRVVPRGGTNLSSGLDLALATVEDALASGRVARVVLVSDGLANQGDTSLGGLRARAARAAAREYALSAIGVGLDFDERLLAALADAGTGNYYYLSDARLLAGVVEDELHTARETVASGLRVQIEPGAGVSVVDAAGFPLERDGAGVAFRPGSLFAGQERRIWVTLRVPSAAPGERELGRFALEYTAGGERHRAAFAEVPRVATVAARDDYLAAIDAEAWERGAAVDAYNAVRQRVAESLQAGDLPSARAELRAFTDRYGALNEAVGSELVEKQLDAARALEAEMEGAFRSGPAQTNRLGKQLSADGLDGRRVGGKR